VACAKARPGTRTATARRVMKVFFIGSLLGVGKQCEETGLENSREVVGSF
jgi:hypothetical protein